MTRQRSRTAEISPEIISEKNAETANTVYPVEVDAPHDR